MKKVLFFILIIVLLLPPIAYGEGVATTNWVVAKGYFGVGGLNLDNKINRASFATVTVRLMGLESEALNYKGKPAFTDIEDFQGGWATSYISIARERGLMSGKSLDKFDPGGNITYLETLVVFMRILGYEDGIDFVSYPDDYYKKALEIGLGDIYIPINEEVYRKTVLDTMVKALNTPVKGKEYTLFQLLNSNVDEDKPMEDDTPIKTEAPIKITMENIYFNTIITGAFRGELKGTTDFTGYKVMLLGNNGAIYGSADLGKSGIFSISNFNIGIVAKINGYRYEVYNDEGKLVLQGDLY